MLRIGIPASERLRACVWPAMLSCAMLASGSTFAQARAGDAANASPSPLAATYQRLGELLAPELIGADDAASHWVSGRLASLEPALQSRNFAAAFARDSKEMLFIASLADACMRPVSPVQPECADRDALGYWSSRDAGNAVPWLLQAERARRRNNVGSLVENLESAARAARYDDYSGRGGAVFLSVLMPLAPAADKAAAVLYAQAQGATPLASPLAALEAVCAASTRALDARIAPHCLRLGGLMAERASSYTNQRAGAQVAQAAAGTDSARAVASSAARTTVAEQDRCREAFATLEKLASGPAGERERAQALGERYLTDRMHGGEPPACIGLHRALTTR